MHSRRIPLHVYSAFSSLLLFCTHRQQLTFSSAFVLRSRGALQICPPPPSSLPPPRCNYCSSCISL